MMFKGKDVFNTSFDVYAGNYHSVRPGYPAALFEDFKDQCEIDGNSRLMEIGAGSGIATVELAKFGCQVIAIEPGTNLAAIAREQTEKFENVKVLEETFESFQSVDKFDVILAFTAFHWLGEGGDKYQKVDELLNDSGSLVLVWNSFFQSDSPATAEVNEAYRKLLPDVYPEESTIASVNEAVLSKLNRREKEVGQNNLFYTVFLKKYLTIYNYDHQTYPKLLNTFPVIIEVEEARRQEFLDHISKVIQQYGKISVPILTTLIICKRRNYFLEMVSKG